MSKADFVPCQPVAVQAFDVPPPIRTQRKDVVIVGGDMAGLAAAEPLRALDGDIPITM